MGTLQCRCAFASAGLDVEQRAEVNAECVREPAQPQQVDALLPAFEEAEVLAGQACELRELLLCQVGADPQNLHPTTESAQVGPVVGGL